MQLVFSMPICCLAYSILFSLGLTGIMAQRDLSLSNSEECNRVCVEGEKPRNCYYHFTLEFYMTEGRACELCKPNNTNQLSATPQCQCVEADGFERAMLSINRMLPGPSIQVCQNDKIIVDVQNNVEGMEAAIHWHGIWQRGSQYYDGVPFLTQCPIPFGTTFRYQFEASNAGTHFYHSHSGLQKIDGQYGSLIVRQPRTVDINAYLYDEDLPTHVILISDWMHEVGIARFPGRLANTPGQIPENVLVNGKGRYTDPATNQTTSVQLESFVVTRGRRYRFRLINSFSSVCPAQLTIEGHTVTLIAQDGESVLPEPVNSMITSSGERVDFILNANQTVGAYWIHVKAYGECSRTNAQQVAILRYNGGPVTPRTRQPNYQVGLPQGILYNPLETQCDVRQANIVCASQLKAAKKVPGEILKPKPDYRFVQPFDFYSYIDSIPDLFTPGKYPRFLVAVDTDHINARVDNISYKFPTSPPISQRVNSSEFCDRNHLPRNCGTPCECSHTLHIKKDAIVEMIFYDKVPQPMLGHPFHLHGYSFQLLKMGRFTDGRNISSNDINLVIQEHDRMLRLGQYDQPPGKDTVSVPQTGYVIFRFKADNPGWWLLHCHFLYHITIGMNVVLHVGGRRDLPPVPYGFPTCSNFVPKIS